MSVNSNMFLVWCGLAGFVSLVFWLVRLVWLVSSVWFCLVGSRLVVLLCCYKNNFLIANTQMGAMQVVFLACFCALDSQKESFGAVDSQKESKVWYRWVLLCKIE